MGPEESDDFVDYHSRRMMSSAMYRKLRSVVDAWGREERGKRKVVSGAILGFLTLILVFLIGSRLLPSLSALVLLIGFPAWVALVFALMWKHLRAKGENNETEPAPDSKTKPWSWGAFAAAGLMTVIPVVVLLIALAPGHPYSYFFFLRWVVCAGALLFVALFHGHQLRRWMYGFGFIALLYNPIIRIHLARDVWAAVLNVLTIAAFVAGFVVLWMSSRRAAKLRT